MNEDSSSVENLVVRLCQSSSAIEKEDWKKRLVAAVNELLVHRFDQLVFLLYKVDVNEKKLKQLLKENPSEDAAVIITNLLLQRQEEKEKSRQAFKKNDDVPDDEKW
jgi:hypothetical protein